MEPKISTEFYLLAIKPDKGTYYPMGNYFMFGLLGAVVFDLLDTGFIGMRQNRICLKRNEQTGFIPFDMVLDILRSKGEQKPFYLLNRFTFKYPKLKKAMVQYLIENNQIIPVRRRFLFIPYYRYFIANRDDRTARVRRVRDVLLRNEKPEANEMYLLSLLSVMSMFRAFSDVRDERIRMYRRLKEILEKGNVYHSDYETIAAVTKGVKQAITSANARRAAAGA